MKIVIKIGSSVIYREEKIREDILKNLITQIVKLQDLGYKVFLVSSGAIALGANFYNFKNRPKKLSQLQSCAAVGQVLLMQLYNKLLSPFERISAQVLLTWDDFKCRKRFINAKNTLLELTKRKTLPIINENDTVSVEEIQFGDNDKLSALVACLVDATRLLIITDVEGLYVRGELVKEVKDINEDLLKYCKEKNYGMRVGGMKSKIEAAKLATEAGIKVDIVSFSKPEVILNTVTKDEILGTRFYPKIKLKSIKRWIAFGSVPCGKIFVDEGAKRALVERNSSLLLPGITKIEGDFKEKDVVEVLDTQGTCFAKGQVNFSAEFLKRNMKKKKLDKEVIHRDYLVIL